VRLSLPISKAAVAHGRGRTVGCQAEVPYSSVATPRAISPAAPQFTFANFVATFRQLRQCGPGPVSPRGSTISVDWPSPDILQRSQRNFQATPGTPRSGVSVDAAAGAMAENRKSNGGWKSNQRLGSKCSSSGERLGSKCSSSGEAGGSSLTTAFGSGTAAPGVASRTAIPSTWSPRTTPKITAITPARKELGAARLIVHRMSSEPNPTPVSGCGTVIWKRGSPSLTPRCTSGTVEKAASKTLAESSCIDSLATVCVEAGQTCNSARQSGSVKSIAAPKAAPGSPILKSPALSGASAPLTAQRVPLRPGVHKVGDMVPESDSIPSTKASAAESQDGQDQDHEKPDKVKPGKVKPDQVTQAVAIASTQDLALFEETSSTQASTPSLFSTMTQFSFQAESKSAGLLEPGIAGKLLPRFKFDMDSQSQTLSAREFLSGSRQVSLCDLSPRIESKDTADEDWCSSTGFDRQPSLDSNMSCLLTPHGEEEKDSPTTLLQQCLGQYHEEARRWHVEKDILRDRITELELRQADMEAELEAARAAALRRGGSQPKPLNVWRKRHQALLRRFHQPSTRRGAASNKVGTRCWRCSVK